ncbi:phospholipase/Carboxylesterase superfamily protein [Coniochaeta ligniaria NRRL 30616]|uniref:Phospholipase/Carboxylesterase superfamily protein n=1 Tax=Coniochaeta ligniaria NRRL 30616 TaxID=1408157 RepID=A0A1J7IQP2_9PEZI|nr:phospholipase/Carboxylesterase superfamily protein [Coniochaeta ligniaria NRRL 30616]
MVQTRVPTKEDFAPLPLTTSLHFPSPPESTTAILLLFHGLGDDHPSFQSFAASLNLPGVLAVSVRGTSPLPPSLLGLTEEEASAPASHFHWGDDITLDQRTGDVDVDPGFEKSASAVLETLIGGVLVGRCGWRLDDILLFGYGQGGSLALGLASRVRMGNLGRRVAEVKEGEEEEYGTAFKGVVSVGGPLPMSMVPTVSARGKSRTPVLVCCGNRSTAVDEDAVELLQKEFETVKVVVWKRPDDGPPRNRDEVLPMMEFFAERLRSPI